MTSGYGGVIISLHGSILKVEKGLLGNEQTWVYAEKIYGQSPITRKFKQKTADSYAKSIYTEKLCSQTPEILKSGGSEDDFSV